MLELFEVTAVAYIKQFAIARAKRKHIRVSTSNENTLRRLLYTYYLTLDAKSGFVINNKGELLAVFSLVKGRGPYLIQEAIKLGATHLTCYDGYLTEFYSNNGFIEDHRENDWHNDKNPEIIYFRLP